MTKAAMTTLKSLQEKVNYKIEDLQDKSKQVFGVVVPSVQIAYDLKTIRLGGQAITKPASGTFKIRLHPAALVKYGDDYINDTVVHEYAHLVQRIMYPSSKPHGREWKSVMTRLGANPSRCHKFDLAAALKETGAEADNGAGRKLKTFTYKCVCSEYQLTSIRHNRARSGKQTYHCKKCKVTLEYVG